MNNAGPLVLELFKLIERSGLPLYYIGKKCGIVSSTITFWRSRSSPGLHNFVAVLDFLGYDLVIVPRGQAIPSTEE